MVRGRHADDAKGFELDSVRRWLNMCGFEPAQVRYSLPNRWRVWISFFKSIEAASAVRLYYCSNLTTAFRAVLLEGGAHHHLQSFWYLQRRKSALQNYLDGNLPPPRARKHDRRSDTFADARKLAYYEYIQDFERCTAPGRKGEEA